MQTLAVALLLACSLAPVGCATYQDDLVRGERAFEASEHERALAILRALEPDISRLNETERAHYTYLRGMTDVRIGYRAEARHWLILAEAHEQRTPGSLPPEWSKRLHDTLKELNEEVYTSGIEGLTNTATPAKPSNGDSTEAESGQSSQASKKAPGEDQTKPNSAALPP
jgi:hypothetical protein